MMLGHHTRRRRPQFLTLDFIAPKAVADAALIQTYAAQFVNEQYQHESMSEFVEQKVRDHRDSSIGPRLKAAIRKMQREVPQCQ